MKPLSLSFSGLRSYLTRVEIDFDFLCEGGLFAIVGPTGAGKSTVLDALFLALFGETPRSTRTDFVHRDADRAHVDLVFETHREGAVQRWRVRREWRRARSRETGLLAEDARAERMALWRVDGELEVLVADRDKGIKVEMESRVLGIDRDQFQRAVILPQGAFDRLLHAPSGERTKLLGRIFDLERYGEALFRRVREWQQPMLRRSEALTTLMGTTHVTAEAFEEAEQGQTQVVAAAAQATEARARSGEALQRLQALATAHAQYREAQGAMAILEAERAGHEAARSTLDAARRAVAVVPRAEAHRGALERLAAQHTRCEAAARRSSETAQAHEAAVREREARAQSLRAERPQLEARLEAARRAVVLVGQRDAADAELARGEVELQAAREAAERARAGAEVAREELARREAQVLAVQALVTETRVSNEARQALEARRERLDAWERARDESAEAAGRLEVATAEGARAAEAVEAVNARLAAATKAEADADADPRLTFDETRATEEGKRRAEEARALNEVDQRLTALEALVDTLHEKRAEAQRAQAAADEARVRADAALEQAGVLQNHASRALDALRGSVDALELEAKGAALAHALHPGAPCPVCGAVEHPRPARVPEALEAARAACAAAEHGANEARAAYGHAEQRVAVARVEATTAARDSADATARLETAEGQLAEERDRARERFGGDPTPAARVRVLQTVAASVEDLRAQFATHKAAFKAAERVREEAVEARKRTEAELQDTQRVAAAQQGRALEAAGRVADCAEAVRKTEAAWRALAQGETPEDLRARATALAEKDRRFEALQAQLETETRASGEAARRNETAKAQATESATALERIHARQLEGTRRRASLSDEITALVPDLPPAEALARATQALEALERRDREAAAHLERALLEHTQAVEDAPRQEAERALRDEAARHAEAALMQALAESGFDSVETAIAAHRDTASLSRLAEEVERWRSAHVRAEADRARAASALDAFEGLAEPDEDTRAAAVARAASAVDAERLAMAAVGEARERLERLRQQRERNARQERAHRALQPMLGRAEALAKAVKGSRLEAFAAERHLRAILQSASRHLRGLTRGRYDLCLVDDALSVRDHFQAGSMRAVSSLSGGESFLASLALAVALSDHVQQRGSVQFDFFFLDEGFGALDPDTLEIALEALEALRGRHRVIGTISHVPAMQDRMPRRLVVHAAPAGGSASVTHEPR
jgi:exonuclease SbcC